MDEATSPQSEPKTDSASSTIELIVALVARPLGVLGCYLGLRLGSLLLASLTPGYHLPPLRGSRADNRCDACSIAARFVRGRPTSLRNTENSRLCVFAPLRLCARNNSIMTKSEPRIGFPIRLKRSGRGNEAQSEPKTDSASAGTLVARPLRPPRPRNSFFCFFQRVLQGSGTGMCL